MANEIQVQAQTGEQVYFQVRNAIAQGYNTYTQQFETFTDTDWFKYSVPMTEQSASGFYTGNFPSAITSPGNYTITIFTGNEYYDGTYISGGTLSWNGTATNTPPVGLAWLALSDYKTMFNITTTATDPQISFLLPMVSVACNNWLGYNPQSQSYTQFYNGNGTMFLRLGVKNVTYISQIIFDYYGDNPTTVAGTEFFVDTTGQVSFLTDSEYRQPFNTEFIQATFTAGWNPLPQDLLLCCGMATQTIMMIADTDTLVTQKEIKDGRTSWASAYMKFLDLDNPMFATCKNILRKYKSNFVY